jgi:histone H4
MDCTNDITKPSITRLSRRGGVKSVSDDCFDVVRHIISNRLDEVLSASIVVNSEHQTKTLMSDDLYDALNLLGYNITQSNDLSTSTCNK